MKNALRIILFTLVLTASSTSAYGQSNVLPTENAGWLETLNYYRVSAGLNPVTENQQLSASVKKHLVYMIMTSPKYLIGPYANAHSENPASPYYTLQGANSGNELISNQSGSESAAIDSWMQAPFHASGLLREGLKSVGFAREFNPMTGFYQFGLDIFSDSTAARSKVLTFPGKGSLSRMDVFQSEYPDPRNTCGVNWASYHGFPIWASLLATPPSQITASLTTPNGKILSSASDLCIVSERNFITPDLVYGPTGKAILHHQHLVLIIPRDPLLPGIQQVSLSLQGLPTISWSFSVVGALPNVAWASVQLPQSITWNAPVSQASNVIVGYDVLVGDSTMKVIQTFSTTATSFATTSLDPGSYWICVNAVGTYRSGICPSFAPYSIQGSSLTASLNYPTKVSVDPILDNPSRITWKNTTPSTTDPKKVVQSVQARIRNVGDASAFFNAELSVTADTFIPPSLAPGNYQVCIAAKNSYGTSECLWEDFSVIPKEKQSIRLAFPYSGNLAIAGSTTTVSFNSYLYPTARTLTPKVCSVLTLRDQAKAKAKKGGSCLLQISNAGDNLNLPFNQSEKITIASLTKIKCIKKDKSVFYITNYNPKCPIL